MSLSLAMNLGDFLDDNITTATQVQKERHALKATTAGGDNQLP